jgi:hypothetical protein
LRLAFLKESEGDERSACRGASFLELGDAGEAARSSSGEDRVYAALFALLVLQARGIVRSVVALRGGHIRRGRIGPRWRLGLSLVLSLVWALFVLVLVPKQLGLPRSIVATGFPDLVYLLLASALVALGWAIVKAVWIYAALRGERDAQVAAT